ncbi:MAG: plasmid partition protein ParG [Candidatus Pacearchaeota archaeon]
MNININSGKMGKIPITVTVDEEVFEEFKKLCENNDIKISTKVNSLMKEWLNNHNKKDR